MRLRFPFVAFAAAAAIFGCGGKSDGPGTFDSQVAVAAGDPCQATGTTAPAMDGCNTCTCSDGAWSCTEVACSTGCEDGATKEAGDGCNTCSCADGQWACTQRACMTEPGDPPPMGCPAPREPDPNVRCDQTVVWAQSPETALCCQYGSGCVSPEGWQTFFSQQECEGLSAGECTPGETIGEGCNSCTCIEDGGWFCPDPDCPDPEPGVSCGGFAGDTCADDEYCAYVEGQLCGAADASATCQKRPQACDLLPAPVCGCDGNDYSNACAASAVGTGVLRSGTCIEL